MDRLKQIRTDIDQCDKQIVELFELRLEKSLEALHYKQDQGLPILQNDREKIVLEKVKNHLRNKAFTNEVEKLYETMMRLSRQVQARDWNLSDFILIGESIVLPIGERMKQNKVAYQGEAGAFGHLALNHYFKDDVIEILNYNKFEDVLKAVQNGRVEYGVLPIENSSTGGIFEIYDLLLKYDLYIVGEQELKIEQHLIGNEAAEMKDITEIYSHNQGFKQSQDFLKDYPDIKQIPLDNTAASAKFVRESNDISKGAIASREAAKLYGLKILKENIHTNDENWTRFIVVGKKLELDKESKKISLIYSLRHNVGSLYESLGIFAEHEINLMKVESRPIQNQPWKYHFYVDVEGNLLDQKVQEAMNSIQKKSLLMKILGNY